jgi:hypothetical protein
LFQVWHLYVFLDGCSYVAHVGLEQVSYLSFLNAGITSVCHCTGPNLAIKNKSSLNTLIKIFEWT